MFGRRSDGKKIRNLDPIQKIMPHIMSKRSDGQNFYRIEVDCRYLDDFIRTQRAEQGVSYNYMTIVIAAMVRLFALRPEINRFVMNGRIFRRNDIQMSYVVKRSLRDTSAGTTVKLTFDGTEPISRVKQMVDDSIRANTSNHASNDTDKTAKVLTNMPNFLIKAGVGLLKWLDKHGMMPKKVIQASPFHTSCFLTNLKSIKIDYIYHHIYDFGTTGIFLAMGKEKDRPVVDEDGTVRRVSVMQIGVVTDERYCDGLYYANSLRMLESFFRNPAQLLEPLEHKVEDVE